MDRNPKKEPSAVRLPPGDELDLHTFAPADVPSLLEEFLVEAVRAGFRVVRVVHGKGMGIQRARVRSILASHPGVLTFRDAPAEGGSWGATVALLDPDRFSIPLEDGAWSSPTPAGEGAKRKEKPRRKRKILFLCTGNACRSQMAEGFARALKGDLLEPYSAGVHPSFVHPMTARVMSEAGVDISLQYSKHVSDLEEIPFDWVVTLCDHADRVCPVVRGPGKRFHRPFPDPVHARGKEAEILAEFREVREMIRAFVETLPESLMEERKKG